MISAATVEKGQAGALNKKRMDGGPGYCGTRKCIEGGEDFPEPKK